MNLEDSTQKVHKRCTCTKSFWLYRYLFTIIQGFCSTSLQRNYQWNTRMFRFLFFLLLFDFIKKTWKCNKKVQHFCFALILHFLSRKLFPNLPLHPYKKQLRLGEKFNKNFWCIYYLLTSIIISTGIILATSAVIGTKGGGLKKRGRVGSFEEILY